MITPSMPKSAIFTKIDFETTNRQLSSVCSVGITVFRDGRIVDEFYSLVRPEPDFFEAANVRVHRITAQAVRNWAERFGESRVSTRNALTRRNRSMNVATFIDHLRPASLLAGGAPTP